MKVHEIKHRTMARTKQNNWLRKIAAVKAMATAARFFTDTQAALARAAQTVVKALAEMAKVFAASAAQSYSEHSKKGGKQ